MKENIYGGKEQHFSQNKLHLCVEYGARLGKIHIGFFSGLTTKGVGRVNPPDH